MWENQILQVEHICNRVEELEQRNGPSSEDSTPTYLVPELKGYNYLCSNFRLQLYFLLLDHNSYSGGRGIKRC